jgi:coenzyme F420-reducing hydrogenase alpha subunit
MHPFTGVVGGFTKIHNQEEFNKILTELKNIIPLSKETIKLFANLNTPKYSKEDTNFVSLSNHETFPLHTGEIFMSKNNKTYQPEQYQEFLDEHFHNNSTAKFASIDGKEFNIGALARINNSFDKLSQETKGIIKELNLNFPSTNLFDNNLAQAIEILHWTQRAIEIIENNTFKQEKIIRPEFEENGISKRGISAIEVPRGILFHDYTFNDQGILTNANIITPTVQNLADMEENIKTYLNQILKEDQYKDKNKLKLEIERMVRSFDPCFSCSTHFLEINFKEK